MKEMLKRWLDALASRLIEYLLDVVLADKVAWLEEQILKMPDMRDRYLSPDEMDVMWGERYESQDDDE